MKQTSTSIRFIIPGLLDPVPYLDQLPIKELPELPIFSRMLSRGEFSAPDCVNESQNNFYHCLLNQASPLSNGIDAQSSIANLSYLCDTQAISESTQEPFEKKWIMRADPCFMVADRDQLVLARTGSLDVSLDEAKTLVSEINQFFSEFEEENFWTLKAASVDRWYIVSDRKICIQSVPPENVLGQPIRSFLFNNENSDNNKDSGHWLNLFNEFQMILHQSKINKKRMTDNKCPINSLWFWGTENEMAHIPSLAIEKSAIDTLFYSDHSFVQNLSQLNHCLCLPVPSDYLAIKNELNVEMKTQQLIFTMDDFIQLIRNKDIFSWVGLLQQFEKNYLLPLSNDLKKGKISQVEFISPTGRKLLLTKKLLNRWWKKKKPYYSFLSRAI